MDEEYLKEQMSRYLQGLERYLALSGFPPVDLDFDSDPPYFVEGDS